MTMDGPPAMTPKPTPDLDKLERLARAATQGEWRDFESSSDVAIVCGPDDEIFLDSGCCRPEDAAFIAEADPPAVLALVARVRELEGTLGDVAEHDCEYGDGCPAFPPIPLNHYRCMPCKAREALGDSHD